MGPGWIFGSGLTVQSTAVQKPRAGGRGDLYGDELGLQLVRVDGDQLLDVFREEVLNVEVAQVVRDEGDKPGGIVQVGQRKEVLFELQ